MIVISSIIVYHVMSGTTRALVKIIRRKLYDMNPDDEDELSSHRSYPKVEDYVPVSTGLSPTEMTNPKSQYLSSMSTLDAIRLMIDEESSALLEIKLHEEKLQQLIHQVVACLNSGGRLFYVGAGTSGRLGVMDASEYHSTFSTPINSVQGIMAGGIRAVYEPHDCAEDTFTGGIKGLLSKDPSCHDMVIGISASGQTPFIWGSLMAARSVNAYVALITFNPFLEFKLRPDLVVSLNVGPEVLTGSTRLKCGTTTKCILNMISTLSMVKMGKTYENLMIDMNPVNKKLKERAVRILLSLNLNDDWRCPEDVHHSLYQNNYDIKKTIQNIKRHVLS